MKKKTLHLNLKKKWFDMILSGEKTEEYREIKKHWRNQFEVKDSMKLTEAGVMITFNRYDSITFSNGYSKNRPQFEIEFKGFNIGYAKPEWSDNFKDVVFVLSLGKVISTSNINTPPPITFKR